MFPVGNKILTQDDGGQMLFQYAETWLENRLTMPLSHSLPLRKDRFSRKECSGFFGGILPEQGVREIVAKNLGISAKNDFAMLEQMSFGGSDSVVYEKTIGLLIRKSPVRIGPGVPELLWLHTHASAVCFYLQLRRPRQSKFKLQRELHLPRGA